MREERQRGSTLAVKALVAAEQLGPREPITDDVARRYGVSRTSLRRAAIVVVNAEPEILAAVYELRIGIDRALRLAKLKRFEQVDALAAWERGERVRGEPERPRPGPFLPHPKRSPVVRRMTRALDQLENAIDNIVAFSSEPADALHANEWDKTLTQMRDRLTELLRARRHHDAYRPESEIRPLQDRVVAYPRPHPSPESTTPL